MCNRDLLIAEAVRSACAEQARNYPDAAGYIYNLDLPAIIASIPAPEPVGEVRRFVAEYDGYCRVSHVTNFTVDVPDGTKLYTSPLPAENAGANEVATINRQLLEAAKDALGLLALIHDDHGKCGTKLRQAIAAAEKELEK